MNACMCVGIGMIALNSIQHGGTQGHKAGSARCLMLHAVAMHIIGANYVSTVCPAVCTAGVRPSLHAGGLQAVNTPLLLHAVLSASYDIKPSGIKRRVGRVVLRNFPAHFGQLLLSSSKAEACQGLHADSLLAPGRHPVCCLISGCMCQCACAHCSLSRGYVSQHQRRLLVGEQGHIGNTVSLR